MLKIPRDAPVPVMMMCEAGKLGSGESCEFFLVFFLATKKPLKKTCDLVVSLGKMLGFYGFVVFFS